MRSIVLVTLCLAACATNDDPSLSVSVYPDRAWISVTRGPDHTFGHVSASINGVDAGLPKITLGHDPGWNTSPFADQPSGASASFQLTPAQIDTSLSVAVDDDGDRYEMTIPDFGTPRVVSVVTPLDQPLHPNDWVEVKTNVPTDRIGDGMLGMLNDDVCFTQWATEVGSGSTKLQLPPDFASSWDCDQLPTAGTPLAIKLQVSLTVTPTITSCTGPSLTCEPFSLFLPDVIVDATVEP